MRKSNMHNSFHSTRALAEVLSAVRKAEEEVTNVEKRSL